MLSRLLTVLTTLVVVASVGTGRTADAQSFYEGKTVRIIVGLAPGGGYDTYARVVARHLGRHIPGNPTVVVENMPSWPRDPSVTPRNASQRRPVRPCSQHDDVRQLS